MAINDKKKWEVLTHIKGEKKLFVVNDTFPSLVMRLVKYMKENKSKK